MMRIAVLGGRGKMGQRILTLARREKDIEIVGVTETEKSGMLGKPIFFDAAEVASKDYEIQVEPKSEVLFYTDDISAFVNKTDVIIDFTTSATTLSILPAIVKAKKAVIIGTTGFSEEEKKKIQNAGKEIPVVFAPNMSIGMNVFFKIIKEAAHILKGYDAEIIELHHNQKKDSPSGTAVKLGEIVAEEQGITKEHWKHGREGNIGARSTSELGMHAIRLGDVVGEHRVFFAGNSELLELTHRAHSRDNFAKGAITAAKWIAGKPEGVYDMLDVLGLK